MYKQAAPRPGAPTFAIHPPPGAAGTASPTVGPTGSAHAAVADQPRSATGAAGHPLVGAHPAGPAVAIQQTARSAGLAHAVDSSPCGAVANERAPQQHGGGRVYYIENVLLQRFQGGGIGGLGAGVGTRAAGQGLNELPMKRRRLDAELLILVSVRLEQLRDGGRHLVAGRGQ
ncbi:hypothetical protein MSIMFB_03454 [Mycobacterium simulans]|uniref:Uncharacterized protein n=1 Tax=Mycobacterium simulans TaxID=627089 RepID=A0A7Z7ILV4_9MYCO|nr:hypothetical protein MSIMFB_03454 [Mycobacterium simulans]